mmetsp:Transcript_56230/g.136284  ORF Transcript_56230/g.136284 Transcript_56230/m.136284 type:complete len:976 (+) Transcript_56230:384-3311(+)
MGAEDENPAPGPSDGSIGKDDRSNSGNNNNGVISRVPPSSLTDAEMKARSARPSGKVRSTATTSPASQPKASSSATSVSAEATETTKSATSRSSSSTTSDRSHRASRRTKQQQQNPGSLLSSTDAAMRKKIVEDNVSGIASDGNSDMVSVTESMAGTVETASGLVAAAAAAGNGTSDVAQPSLEPGAYRVSGPEGPNDDYTSEGGHNNDSDVGGADNSLTERQESAVESALGGMSDRQQLQAQSSDNGVESLNAVDALAVGVDTTTTTPSSSKNDTKNNDIDEAGILSGDAVVAQPIDEADLEQQYRDQFMKDVVEASVVDKDVELAKKKRRRMFIGISVVVIALALGLGLGLGLKEQESPPLTAEEVLYDLVSPWSSPEDLADPSSPQSTAFNWVLNDDPLDLTGGLVDGSTNSSTVLERYVLSVLYWSTDGPNWTNQLDFMTNNSVCDWPDESKTSTVSYVNCNENGDLFDIRIDSNNLNGTIPSELAAVSTLAILTFNTNDLRGTLPSQLGLLTSLFWFTMTGNMLTGSIPEQIASLPLLRSFALNQNQLTGTIPPILLGKNEAQLRYFIVDQNHLTGTIPPLRTQSAMEYFLVEDNNLNGTIPLSLYAQPSLLLATLSRNNLSGTIAEQIDGLASVEQVEVRGNSFTGPLPRRLGNLKQLRRAWFSDNQLTGPIPETWSGLRDIESIDLSNNNLSATLPENLSTQWQSLDFFSVESNPMMDGSVPNSLGELPTLTTFDLRDTGFTSGLEEVFCSKDVLPTSISADCGGEVPQIECSCCSSCCDADGGSCVLNITSACNAKAGSLVVMDPSRNATCSCNDDFTVVSCNDDDTCVSCNGDESDPNTQCAVNTEYGYILDPTTGEIAGFQNTLVHTSGPWTGTTVRFYDDVTTPTFDIYVDGEKCDSAYALLCPSGFSSYIIDCTNIDDSYYFHPCESEESLQEYGLFNILLALDPSNSFGTCSILFTKVNQFF